MNTDVADHDSIELVNHAPSVKRRHLAVPLQKPLPLFVIPSWQKKCINPRRMTKNIISYSRQKEAAPAPAAAVSGTHQRQHRHEGSLEKEAPFRYVLQLQRRGRRRRVRGHGPRRMSRRRPTTEVREVREVREPLWARLMKMEMRETSAGDVAGTSDFAAKLWRGIWLCLQKRRLDRNN